MIYMFLHKQAVRQPNQIIKALFSAFAPHYLLSRCLYDISQTYLEASGRPNADPFTYAVTGRAFLLLALQAAGTPACAVLCYAVSSSEATVQHGCIGAVVGKKGLLCVCIPDRV